MKKQAFILNSLVIFILVISTALTAVNIQVAADTGQGVQSNQPLGTSNNPYAPGVVLVGLRTDSVPQEAINDLDELEHILPEFSAKLEAIGVHAIDPLVPPSQALGIYMMQNYHQHSEVLRLRLSENADIQSVVVQLTADPSVAFAEPDYLASYVSEPNDPYYEEQWGLSKVNVEAAWNQTSGSPNVVIAVIDSGLDLDHEDLAPNLWVNPGEIPDNESDDDNNGFIDDVRGWNFVDKTNNVQDFVGHGSQVSGVAVARTGNELGIAGVCGECRVMPVKVSQISGVANYSDIAAGIYYAVGKGARVINLSLGGYAHSDTLQNAIEFALNQNVVVVAGAGNDNKSDPFYPATYAGVISVAGTDPDDIKTNFSNFGSWVDLTAPGQDILTTTLDDYNTNSGTSFATPFVSGAAGLQLSLNPDWTPAMVRSQFMQTADDINAQNPGLNGQLGAGRLNIDEWFQEPEPLLTYEGYALNGTPNLRPNFGITASLTVTVGNSWADAVDVSGTLSSSDPNVTITHNLADFGTILVGESRANTNAFIFDIASAAGYSHSMPFSLNLSANDGSYQNILSFQIQTRSSIENVSGTISSDTTWTSDKTYLVTGNVGIAPGYTLTIEPGTTVQFSGDYSLNVGGTLLAQGTEDFPIMLEHEMVGETWDRVFFDNSSQDAQLTAEGIYQTGNILQHVNLSGASGGIACSSATPYLSYITSDQGGFTCSLGETNLWLVDTHLTGTVNVTQGGAEPEMLVRVTDNGGNITLPAASVVESQFYGALTINGPGHVSETRLGALTINGVGEVQNVTSTGQIEVGNNSIIENSTLQGGIIRAGGGSTITRNNVENIASTAITVSGIGTVTYNRIVSTQKGIVVMGGTVENNLIAYTSDNGLEPGTAAVRHNTLIGIEGNAVHLTQVPTAFEFNNFEFNSGSYDIVLNIEYSLTEEVNAQNNWWGTIDQNKIKERIYDYEEDYNLAKLITTLPLTEPSQTAPGYVRTVTLDPASPVGIQTVDFTIEFSRPMNLDNNPTLAFLPLETNKWANKSPMPTERYYLGAVTANNCMIYAIGGLGEASYAVERYNPLTDTWIKKFPMPRQRYRFGIAQADNGLIYTFGGLNTETLVEAYDPLTHTWISKSPMPTPRFELGVAVASNGIIYAIGGRNGEGISSAVEAYDPLTDTWTIKKPMPTPRFGLGVVTASNGKIYVIGGFYSLWGISPTVEEYDPTTDTWTTKAPMLTPRTEIGVTATSTGMIYAVGGRNNKSGDAAVRTVEAYNIFEDTWSYMPSMNTERSRFGLVTACNGKIYAIGGDYGDCFPMNKVEEYTPLEWNSKEIVDNPKWLDPYNFQASYEFTALNPRDDYRVLVSGITDPDGIPIAPDSLTIFTVDYAGGISDPTPPPTPQVLAWGDGGLTQLTSRAYMQDSKQVISGYRYAIGSTPGGTDVVSWTHTSQTQVTHTGLILQQDQAYYVSFQARNAGGIWSETGISNAVVNGSLLPAPTLSGLDPSIVIAGGKGFTLTVSGATFVEESIIRWNGQKRVTTFISPTEIKAYISADDITAECEITITVFTPSPTGGGTSNSMILIVTTNKIFLPVIKR